MRIWVDADACPGEIKELLYRAAERRRIRVTLVANQPLRTPSSQYVDSVCVPYGMNIADRHIVELVSPGDLVITADIPLSAAAIEKGAQALDPRLATERPAPAHRVDFFARWFWDANAFDYGIGAVAATRNPRCPKCESGESQARQAARQLDA